MNALDFRDPRPGPLTGIIRFLAIVGLLTIFLLGTALGMVVVTMLWAG